MALAIACNGSDSDKTGATGDSTTTPGDDDDVTGTDCAPDGPYTGPTTITTAAVSCDGTNVTFTAETQGVTLGGIIFSQETGTGGAQWSDNHDLASVSFDAVCNTFDNLSATVAASGVDERNVSSLFTCADHYDVADKMTYAVSVNDATGNNVSCYAFGHDVQGMKDGTYNDVGQGSDFDLANCVEGAAAR